MAHALFVAAACVPAVLAQAAPTPGQKCAAAKLKATGLKAKSKLYCYATAATRPTANLGDCLLKAESKFAAAFVRAENVGGCTTSSDADPIENGVVDPFVDDIVAALPSSGPTNTPTSTGTATQTPTPTRTPLPSATPTPPGKTVFVTSGSISNGALGGLAGADGICASRAAAASLPGTFKAWLSDSSTSAAFRMIHNLMPYRLVDGTQVADNWNDMTDGSLDHAINEDEHGNVIASGYVWTNTNQTGGVSDSNYSCSGWSTASSSFNGINGSLSSAGVTWTNAFGDDCAGGIFATSHLYCIEQ